MITWAAANMKLHKKPISKKPVINLGVKRDDALMCKILDEAELMWSEQISQLATHIDLQTEQMEIQVNFI